MNTDKELIDYVVSIFPAHPGCVAMCQFHSLFVNIVLPAYAKLRQDEVALLQEEQVVNVVHYSPPNTPLTWDGVMVTARLPDGDPLGPFLHYPPDVLIKAGQAIYQDAPVTLEGVVVGKISNARNEGGQVIVDIERTDGGG